MSKVAWAPGPCWNLLKSSIFRCDFDVTIEKSGSTVADAASIRADASSTVADAASIRTDASSIGHSTCEKWAFAPGPCQEFQPL